MVRATFTQHGGLPSAQEFGLVGLNDVRIVQGAQGPTLFAATRGDGWLSAYSIGTSAGQTTLAQQWRIAPSLLQLETTDLVLRDVGGTQELFMAGLNSSSLTGVRLDSDGAGPRIDAGISFTAAGHNLGNLAEVELFNDGNAGIAALRTGGLVSLSFGSGTAISLSNVHQGAAMQGQRARDITTATHDGQTYAFVSYQGADTVSMFKQSTGGALVHVTDMDAADGFWVDRPGALTVTTAADGRLYLVVAGAGTDSLSTFQVSPNGMVPVDHLIDSLDTRFADASHVTSLRIGDHNFVIAAGSDSGISLFTMLPGGRLQHIDSMPGSIATPLRGITSLDAMATPQGIRLWVSTETAPYLSEFSMALPNLGVTRGASAGGSTLTGSVGDDVLAGAAGSDRLVGGFGNDILMDGAGADSLRGDGGRDTFVLVEDGARDVIEDFQLGFDRIDLSDFSQISGIGGLTITSRAWGAEIRIGTEILEVRNASGASLRAQDFTTTNLITGNRIPTDPATYPGGTGTPRPDPNPGSVENPTGIDPNTLAPLWINEPTFLFARAPGDYIGTDAADVIQTGGQNDRLFGGQGNDTIMSGAGHDRVDGEGGNDWIHGGGDNDLLFGGAGFDTIDGGDGQDTILGDTFADSLIGGVGDDIMLGGDGFDQIQGGIGNDRIWAGAAPDRVFGGAGNDWISAGSNFGTSVDGIFGEDGNDTLFGNAGFDVLNGGEGDDLLDGGHQSDNLYGEAGNDTLLGDLGFDRLFGGSGNDMLYGGGSGDGVFGQEGDDTLWGGEDGDRMFGGQGNDILDGGSGNDTIYADAGFDRIIGGADNDLMYGSYNADEFIFGNNHGNDTIGDFDALNANEVLNFANLSAFTRFSDVMGAASQSGQDVLINTGGGSSIRLRNVRIEDLDETDFVF